MNEETEPSISRSVVATGAPQGIGKAAMKAFLVQGDRAADIPRFGKAPDGALALAADVTDPDALVTVLVAVIEACGSVEVLVASAGINRESLATCTSSQMWDEVISADLIGISNTVRAVTSAMMRARKGRIVLVSPAIAARGGVGLSVYGVTKGDVEGPTRSLVREPVPRGITINAVAPGFVTTAIVISLPDHIRTAYLEQIPLGYFADVTDIAGLVPFLVSPAAVYVTGTTLGVDGGLGTERQAHGGERDVVGIMPGQRRGAVG